MIDKKAILEEAYSDRIKALFAHLCDRIIDAKIVKGTKPFDGFVVGVKTADEALKHALELLECSK